ncbi:hypothetical protein MishRS11D_43470 (plasmid) [Methylomagnum ishizawai]|nr:hypothetical protein MishRS11D_43470 [Methylomagnum ishizawai]
MTNGPPKNPNGLEMSEGQWLLVTLTAGVALMGQAKGVYSFMTHLRWLPAILLGYAASVGSHFLINAGLF